MVTAWLQAQAWKLGTIGAGVVALALGVSLAVEKGSHHKTEQARLALEKRINDPKAGLLVVQAQLRTNVSTLTLEVGRQNREIQRQADDSAIKLAAAARELTEAQAATRAAERRIGVLLRPLEGKDVCPRVDEMDRRFLESLK